MALPDVLYQRGLLRLEGIATGLGETVLAALYDGLRLLPNTLTPQRSLWQAESVYWHGEQSESAAADAFGEDLGEDVFRRDQFFEHMPEWAALPKRRLTNKQIRAAAECDEFAAAVVAARMQRSSRPGMATILQIAAGTKQRPTVRVGPRGFGGPLPMQPDGSWTTGATTSRKASTSMPRAPTAAPGWPPSCCPAEDAAHCTGRTSDRATAALDCYARQRRDYGSVPGARMSRVAIAETGDATLTLRNAVLLYRTGNTSHVYATLHDIAEDGHGRPSLLAGRPMTLPELATFAHAAAARTAYQGFSMDVCSTWRPTRSRGGAHLHAGMCGSARTSPSAKRPGRLSSRP